MKGVLLASLPAVLAASETVPGFEWGTVSATALLGWYLWYTTRVVFPSQRAEVSAMQDHFATQFTTQRDHYEKLLDELQGRHDKRHEQIVESLEKISETLTKEKTE
jgi:hypothetical protein